jgi:hypothetical protein
VKEMKTDCVVSVRLSLSLLFLWGLAHALPHTKAGALPFSRSLREGGAFRGLSVTARLVDLVLQIDQGMFVRHSGSSHQEVISFPCPGD